MAMSQFLDEHAERLGIDDATREKMRAIEENAREEGQGFEVRQQQLHQEMHALLDVEKPDVAAVMRQADKMGEAHAEALKHHLRAMLAIRALLTPEQLKELVRIHHEEQGSRRRDE